MRTEKKQISLNQLGQVLSNTKVYQELAESPLVNTDPLEALQSNIQKLMEIQSRSQFMAKEVRFILRVKAD